MADTLPRTENEPVPKRADGPLGLNYLSFTGAMSLSQLGDSAWYVALTWTLIRDVSPAMTGTVLMLASLPRLIGLLGGGVIADRSGPRRVMVITDVLRGAVMLAAALVVSLSTPSVPVLLGAALLLAFISAFFIPASGSVKPLILADKDLVRGNALFVFGIRGGQAAGGPIGAWLIALGGVPLVAVANAVSFLLSAFASARVRYTREPVAPPAPADPAAPAPAKPPFKEMLLDGLRYLRRERRIRLVILVIALTELACAPPVNIGLVLLSNRLDAGATGAGLLLTGYTVGAVASSVVTMTWPPGRRGGLVLTLGVAASAVCLTAMAFIDSLLIGMLLYGVLGLVTGQFGLVLVSMAQRWTEPAMRGRVMSVLSLAIFACAPLANVAVGTMVTLLGFSTAMTVFAAFAVAAALIVVGTPSLRGVRLD
ncbi:MFS transporter [Kitasatospora sp. NPDC101801]|uniref:MFS transporter n=1 Tax=Kitasatospora sp. NPDC101801 TaxID=3364103 RepID=UPI0037F1D7A1